MAKFVLGCACSYSIAYVIFAKKSGQITHSKPNIFELEELKNQMVEKTAASSSFLKLSEYYKFFNKILSFHNPNLNEVFLKEFLDDYISVVSRFDVWGIESQKSKDILEQLKEVSALSIASENLSIYKNQIERIEKQLKDLGQILSGGDKDEDKDKEKEYKAFFPLVPKEAEVGFYGILESITIHISKAANEDKFIIVPSEKEIEKKILEQCKTSWLAARDLSRAYIKKPYKHHEVIISFDKRDGFYEGSSLGVALTISFLEQLLKFYNPTYIIKIKEQTAFTGGMTDKGKVLPTGEEIIKQKVSAVFFSDKNTFVVPKADEPFSLYKLDELYKPYPKRNLKLIPVEDINDVLNRRDVIDIRKQKLVVRTAKFVKKNWVSAVVTVLLAILFGYLFVVDWDDNPTNIYADGTTVYIKNRNGKVLWTQKFSLPKEALEMPTVLDNFVLIDDVNNDGKNEVLFTRVNPGNEYKGVENWSIFCLNYEKNFKWKFTLKDTVISKREIIPPPYRIEIIDTLNEHGRKRLIVFANSALSFASAIFKIDLQTGQKVGEIFWSSGHISNAMLRDVNGDGVKEVVQWGHDNGYEDVILCCINVDSLIGFRHTTNEYKVLNKPQANLLGYIRFPKNDYEQLTSHRVSLLYSGCFNQTNDENNIVFSVNIYKDLIRREEHTTGVFYQVSNNLKDIDVFIHDDFRILRDTLVARGTLKQPYTDTKEYIDILKSKILYYKDGKWVKREELD